MKTTLEQQRAQDAWSRCARYRKEDVNFAKGMPALLMNSGLLQVLAYCQEKGGAPKKVADDLRAWLVVQVVASKTPMEFGSFMEWLIKASPVLYQSVNAEAFAWLRWMRQMAAARAQENDA